MDYPKSVPNVGLVDGQFADENPATGQVGSLIPSAWGNAVTQELLNVIKAAGFSPAEGQTNQLLKAIQGLVSQGIKNSVRVATTGAIALSGVQTIDAIVLVAGDRVLVKNQASGVQNGIYVVAAGAWVRALDADESVEVKPGMLVGVDAGTVNGGSVWRLSNATPPTLGATALTFEQVFGKTGVVAGSYKSVTVGADGRVTGGTNPTTLAGFGITDAFTRAESNAAMQAAIAALVGSAPESLNAINELAAALGNDPNFATTILNLLAGKADKVDTFNKAEVEALITALADDVYKARRLAVQGAFRELLITTTGLSSLVKVKASDLVVKDGAGSAGLMDALAVTIDLATVGANGLDAGTPAASTWYSVWAAWNGTTAIGLLSLSATTPALPAGYTYKSRIGWIRTDSTANKYPLAFIQAGNDVQYTPKASGNVLRFPAMSTGASIGNSGVAGGAVAVSTLGVVPPTASRIRMSFTQTGSGSANGIIVPSNNYGIDGSSTAPPIGLTISGEQGQQPPIEFMLETSDIYMSCGSAYTLSCIGWRDSL